MKSLLKLILPLALVISFNLSAEELKLVPVADKVWAIVGSLGNRTAENLGNNATFGFVETDESVVLIDSGGTYLGAQKIHALIQSVTKKPVKYVINTGGQDHRWFGNSYFSDLGATIISSQAARIDHEKRLSAQMGRLTSLIGDENFIGTKEKYADELFEHKKELIVGGVGFTIIHAGQAHTPGDAFVVLNNRSIVFSGDIVYVERMLGVGEQSNSKSWLKAFASMASSRPMTVVPGHGHPVSLAVAEKDTYNYLLTLREKVGLFLTEGGDASEISQVNMTEYNYLFNYDTLSGRNALKVFTELEWE